MSTKAKRHVHKYHSIMAGSQKLWACALSDCAHIMPKHYEATLPGKNSECWSCGNMFLLNEDNMLETRPRCDKCRGIRKMDPNTLDEFFSGSSR